MESPGSSIRSAARATFSAPKRVPIRWRLAGGSALLTLVILCGFAGAVGTLTAQRIHSDFDTQVRSAADRLRDRLIVHTSLRNEVYVDSPGLNTFGGAANAAIKIVYSDGQVIKESDGAPEWLGPPTLGGTVELRGYRIENRRVPVTANIDDHFVGYVYMQYARPLADVQATVNRVRFFLARRRAQRRRARAPRRPVDRDARDGADRRADGGRARDRAHARPRPPRPHDGGRRRGRGAVAHARRDARRARRGAHGAGVRPAAPARVRRRRLPRAAHAADERPGQPGAARRDARRRSRRGGAVRAALQPPDAPPRRRPPAARPCRRRASGAEGAHRRRRGPHGGRGRARAPSPTATSCTSTPTT